MILSHQHKFVFIKGEKVAGTSAEIALSQICGPEDTITPVSPIDERYRIGTPGEPRNYTSHLYPASFRRLLEQRYAKGLQNAIAGNGRGPRLPKCRFANHMDLRTVLRLAPGASDYEILCVERSPYAKVMSFANWAENYQTYGKSGKLPSDPARLAGAVARIIADGSMKRVYNIDRYRDFEGRVKVKPWRSETLASDMRAFFDSRHVEAVPLVNAKQGAKSDSLDPAAVLPRDQISAINEMFAEEFELFGWPMID